MPIAASEVKWVQEPRLGLAGQLYLPAIIDELRCIYCGMCEQACPVDAIELTTLYDLTGLSREDMMFDKEKLLAVFDETVKRGTDPVRTRSGRLSVASEVLPDVGVTSSSS